MIVYKPRLETSKIKTVKFLSNIHVYAIIDFITACTQHTHTYIYMQLLYTPVKCVNAPWFLTPASI